MSLPTVETTVRVELIPSGLAVDARQLERAVADGVDGFVLAASGNTTPEIGDAVANAVDSGVPVVIATRCFDGAVEPGTAVRVAVRRFAITERFRPVICHRGKRE